MRRGLKRMIPVFALALLVQLLSPIGAIRFVASAAADPLATVHLCSAMASSDSAPASAPGLLHDGGCCAICAVGIGDAPNPAAVQPAVALVEPNYLQLSWPHREPAPPARRSSADAQPRAPPAAV